VGARRRAPRRERPQRPSGQHFLRSRSIAEEIVLGAGLTGRELVVEIGAGTGRLTEALVERADRLIAIELDPWLVARLRSRFARAAHVTVLEEDVLEAALPSEPFHVVGNVPFGLTTPILRRLLDDPGGSLVGLDVIVQYEVARKRSSVWPTSLRDVLWAPWWRAEMTRRLSARCFDPPPSVDAGLLSVRRRVPPLIPVSDRPAFARIVASAYRRAGTPVGSLIRLPRPAWKRFAAERGISPSATAAALDAFDWAALYRLMHSFDR
jgi:23S rRNA (adenine-N6)-dimethyltransferase